ncbi:MAG: hypothetical protein NW223_04040 [Hyphomicrobiaceae bacterium]|nr:hypothetical protein [Hyphomicrobiaceae bacterium]
MTQTAMRGLILASILLGGCSQQLHMAAEGVVPQGLATGSIPKAVDAGTPDATYFVSASPTDAYAAVAQGALNCWFGANGPMKRSHVFHADANPPANGGGAEIVLLEKNATLTEMKGARAFRVAFVPSGAGTQVAVTRLKVDEAVGGALGRDVETWARGQTGCALRSVLPPTPDAAPVQSAAKPKSGR